VTDVARGLFLRDSLNKKGIFHGLAGFACFFRVKIKKSIEQRPAAYSTLIFCAFNDLLGTDFSSDHGPQINPA
jgi:hypothetical protein